MALAIIFRKMRDRAPARPHRRRSRRPRRTRRRWRRRRCSRKAPPGSAASCTSSSVMRPPEPLPCTEPRSTFSLRASTRVRGVASGRRAAPDGVPVPPPKRAQGHPVPARSSRPVLPPRATPRRPHRSSPTGHRQRWWHRPLHGVAKRCRRMVRAARPPPCRSPP